MLDLTSSIDTEHYKAQDSAASRRSTKRDDSFARTLQDVTRPQAADTSAARQIDMRAPDTSRQDVARQDNAAQDSRPQDIARNDTQRNDAPRNDAAPRDNATTDTDTPAPRDTADAPAPTDKATKDDKAAGDAPDKSAQDKVAQEKAAEAAALAAQIAAPVTAAQPTPAAMISLIAQAGTPAADQTTGASDQSAQGATAAIAQTTAAGTAQPQQQAAQATLAALQQQQEASPQDAAVLAQLAAKATKPEAKTDAKVETTTKEEAKPLEAAANKQAHAQEAGLRHDMVKTDMAKAENAEKLMDKLAPQADAAQAGDTARPVATAQNDNLNFASQLAHVRGEALTTTQTTATSAVREAVPLDKVGVEIATAAKDGVKQIEIRLDPGDMGRIDVRLDVDNDGNVNTWLIVDKPETLDQLKKDAPNLQRSLEEAGLKTDSGSLNFSLRDQNNRNAEQDDTPRASQTASADPEADGPAPLANNVSVYRGWVRGTGGVDLKI